MIGFIFFTLFLSVLVLLFNFSLKNKFYIEKSLYQFRQGKHDLTIYISEHIDILDKTTYAELKDLLYVYNVTINNFSMHHKMVLSMIKMVMINTIMSGEKLEQRPVSSPVAEEFKKVYVQGIDFSLKATPFLKARLFLFIMKVIFRLLGALGYRKFRNGVRRVETFAVAESKFEEELEHCVV